MVAARMPRRYSPDGGGGGPRFLGKYADLGVPIPHIPPLWRESRVGVEMAALRSSAVWRGGGVPDGAGRPVLLIPGFLAGDASLATMTQWLRQNGYHTRRAGIRMNVGCSSDAIDRLEERVEEFAALTGERVALIGQSRGGIFARHLAVRRPDLVSGIVTLGSPTVNQLSTHPLVLAQVALVGVLGTGRFPGMLRVSCLRGACCERFREEFHADVPPEVGFVALYSKTDGIVNWQACLDPCAQQVEVHASHVGMGANAEVYAEVGNALGRFGHRWARTA
jgi:pimeloyl-ACP methyl ester carboxylesterase